MAYHGISNKVIHCHTAVHILPIIQTICAKLWQKCQPILLMSLKHQSLLAVELLESLHPHAGVHETFAMWRLQCMVRHLVLHEHDEHDTSSMHASGIGSSVTRIGCNLLSHVHPISVTSGRCGTVQSASFHMLHWWCTCCICNWRASFVGGIISGWEPFWNMNMTLRAASSESTLSIP